MFHSANAQATNTSGLSVVQFTATDAVDDNKILTQLIIIQTDSMVSRARLAVQGFWVRGRHTRYNLSVNISTTYQISNLATAIEISISVRISCWCRDD
jgi:hypothetical protein